MKLFLVALMLCLCSVSMAEERLTGAQKKAIAKYDNLPEKYRTKIVAAWKAEYERYPKGRTRLVKNNPTWYPDVFRNDGLANLSMHNGDVGTVGEVHLFQVVGPTRVIVQQSKSLYYFVDGIDASDMSDGHAANIKGLFVVDGTESYETVGGAKKTLHVVRPIDKQ